MNWLSVHDAVDKRNHVKFGPSKLFWKLLISMLTKIRKRYSHSGNLKRILGDPGAVSRVGRKGGTNVFCVFFLRVKEPLGTDSHRTISKNSSGCRFLIEHKKCFVLWCPIGEQFLPSSFGEFVHDGCCLDHGLSGSCTKEMHAVRKLSVWYKIPIWFQNTVCPKTKDAFPKIQAWAYNRYSRLHLSRLA